MTLKNNSAPLLYYIKHCASFQTIGGLKLELQSGNTQFRSKSAIFCLVWPWNSIYDLEKPTSSFVHHFIAIGKFKLELQSRNPQFGSKLEIFCPVWPWNLTDDLEKQSDTSSMLLQALCFILKPYVNSNCSYSLETAKFGFWPLWPWPLTSNLVLFHWHHFCKW